DTETVLMGGDVVDDYRKGRSSSAAKKANADFRISLARRSSRFFFSSSARRSASVVVCPGFSPLSTWAWRTQARRVSELMPSCSAVRLIAPCLVAGSASASSVIRVARALSSSEYFFGAGIGAILPWFPTLHQTRESSRRIFSVFLRNGIELENFF